MMLAPGEERMMPLERLYFHLAELHHPRAVLKRDRAAGKLVVPDIDGAGSIERDDELRAFGRDLVDVPLAARLRHGRDLRHIDDRAGAVRRLGTLVVDVHLVAVCRGDFLRIGAAQEDAAVGVGVDPELGPDLEIGVRVLRHEKAVALVGLHDALGQPPVGVADLVPVLQARAVEQRGPACVALRWRLDRKSTRLNSSHMSISYAVFCLKKKKKEAPRLQMTMRLLI